MSNTDKQPQTCYVPEKSGDICCTDTELNTDWCNKLESVYIHTPEELEALKAKWMREAAEKAIEWYINKSKQIKEYSKSGHTYFRPSIVIESYLSIVIESYLDEKYPIK